MSDNEYYLLSAERTIASLCKESKEWQDREENVIGLAKFLSVLFGAATAVLFLGGTPLWIFLALITPIPLFVIPAARRRMAVRKARYEEQLDQAIERRDRLKRKLKGF